MFISRSKEKQKKLTKKERSSLSELLPVRSEQNKDQNVCRANCSPTSIPEKF